MIQVLNDDCLDWMKRQPDNSFQMTFGSPPYERARTYGIDFSLKGQDWVDWMVARMVEMVRITDGLVAMVVEGQTRQFRYSATPALLMADLHRAGVHLRKPPIFKRVGIPGSGGPDWLRNDYEFIVCCTAVGKLPWSDNTAMGHPPKWAPGGAMSHRLSDGTRRNQWGHSGSGNASRKRNGKRDTAARKSHKFTTKRRVTRGTKGGDTTSSDSYTPPKNANPGNVVECIVGGGVMGSKLCHENEAPFPEALAEMSYDLELRDPITRKVLELESPHQMKGGTYQLGGCPTAEINITYNYSQHYGRVFESRTSDHQCSRDGMLHGIRSIYGLTGAEAIPVVERAMSQLGDDVSEDYWDATEGNAKRALTHVLALSRLRPDGVWDGD